MKQTSREWWIKRQKGLNLLWCDTPNPMFPYQTPQAYWFEVGVEYAKFRDLVDKLDSLLEPIKRGASANRGNLFLPLTELMWTGEHLVWTCVGSEYRKDVQNFLYSVTYLERLEQIMRDPERLPRFAEEISTASHSLIDGIYDFCDESGDCLPTPMLPKISALVDVRDDLNEARDLVSLGYEDTALFVLTRCLESVLRAFIAKYDCELELPPGVEKKVGKFEELINTAAAARLRKTGRSLLSSPMRSVADGLRHYRNQLAHDDDLQDGFFQASTAEMATLTVKLLETIEAHLTELTNQEPNQSGPDGQ
jgi:hypothetical protein